MPMSNVVPLMSACAAIRTCSMQERAANLDFEIRREGARAALDLPHRHELIARARARSGALNYPDEFARMVTDVAQRYACMVGALGIKLD
jgi:hypothetical protein